MYVSFEKSARKATGMIANLRHLAKNIDKIFCLSAYLLVLSIGCNKVERPFSKVLEPECRIQVDLKESNSFEFDDFFSGIEVVPLENYCHGVWTYKCLLGGTTCNVSGQMPC